MKILEDERRLHKSSWENLKHGFENDIQQLKTEKDIIEKTTRTKIMDKIAPEVPSASVISDAFQVKTIYIHTSYKGRIHNIR